MNRILIRGLLETAIISALLSSVHAQTGWLNGYYRGVGLPAYCADPSYPQLSGYNCFANCAAGTTFYAFLGVCQYPCPVQWNSNLNTCTAKTGGWYSCSISSYGFSGSSYTLFNSGSCNSDSLTSPITGCRMIGLLYYPHCVPGYSDAPLVTDLQCCYNGGCPSGTYPGMTPVSGANSPCYKPSYTPASIPSVCPTGLVFGTDGLCYPACLNGFNGATICWPTSCPSGSGPNICNSMLCTTNAACSATETTLTTTILTAINAAITASGQFNMENILRTTGPTTLSSYYNMAGSTQTFTQIDTARTAPYACNQRRFPIFLGSTTAGITDISFFKLDTFGNIGVAGYSTDTGMIGSSGNHFVGLLEYYGFNFTWVHEISSTTQTVADIGFSLYNKEMIVLLSSSPMTVIVYQSLTGSVLSKVTASSAVTGSSIVMDPVTNWITIAASDSTPNLMLVGLDLINQPSMISVPYMSFSGATLTPQPMVRDSAGNYYIASYSSSASTLTITTIQVATAAGVSWNPTHIDTYQNGAAYYPKRMSLFEDSSNKGLFISADSLTGGILLFRKGISPASTDFYVYQENNNEALVSLDATAISFTQMIVIFKNTARATFQIMTVDFASSGQIGLQRKILTQPVLSMSQISFARAQVSGDYFLSGHIVTYGKGGVNCMTGTNSKGFILSSADADLCQTMSSFGETSLTYQALSSFTYQTLSLLSSTSSLSLTNTAPTTTLLAQSKLYQVPNSCCLFTGITPSVFANQVYIMDYPEQQQPYSQFTFPNSPIAPTQSQATDLNNFGFWYYITSTPPIPVDPVTGPAFYFHDTPNLYFSQYSYNPAFAGTYTITVTAVLPNHQPFTSAPFTIQLFLIPNSVTITNTPVLDISYIVSQPNVTSQTTNYTSSNSIYYVTYHLQVLDPVAGTYSDNIDTDLFIFTQGGRTNTFTIGTLNNTKVGLYKMALVGRFAPHLYNTASSYFQVNILHQCYLTSIVTSSLPSEVTFVMQLVPSAPVIINFDQWTESLGICGAFTYSASLVDKSPLPNFMQFSKVTRQFNIQQTKNMVPQDYLVMLTGTLLSYYKFQTVAFKVTVLCAVGELQSTQQDMMLTYVPGSPQLRLQINDFIQNPMCGADLAYTATMADGSPMQPHYLQLVQSTNSLGFPERFLIFQAQVGCPIQQFVVVVSASTILNPGVQKVIKSSLRITINIQGDANIYTDTVYPPTFFMVQSGKSQMVPFAGDSTSGNRILDAFSTVVTLTKYKLAYISGALSDSSVTLIPSSEPYASYSSGVISITPSSSTPQDSRFVITAVAEDSLKKVFKITQNIVILAYQGAASAASLEQLKVQMLSLLQVTISEVPYQPATEKALWDSEVNVTENPDPELRMKIASVDQYGKVNIVFNKPLQVVHNVSLIDSKVLIVNLISGAPKTQRRDFNFTWSSLNMTSTLLQLQLAFEDPIFISSFQVSLFPQVLAELGPAQRDCDQA